MVSKKRNPLFVLGWDGKISRSLVMTIGDPRDRFFYPTLTFMMDPYRLNPACSATYNFVCFSSLMSVVP